MMKSFSTIFSVLFVLCILPYQAFPAGSGELIHLSQNEQLFLDDVLIEKMENVTRRINQVQKFDENPVLVADKPWEGNLALIFGTAMYDQQDSLFKMWYYCDGGNLAYATSKNGINWQKPELDVILRDGQRTNLVIEQGGLGHFYEIFGVLKDENDPNPERRYKIGFLSFQRNYSGKYQDRFHKGSRRALGTASSPDGIHWTLEEDFASYAVCDISRFLWDDRLNRYVLYGRTKLTDENNDGRWRKWGWGRAVTRIESEDFRHWSDGEMVLAADANDPEGTEIYSMSVFPYGDIYIGFVQMYYDLPDQGNLDFQLAVSRDGKVFNRVAPRKPFIPEGEIGDWDRFNISLGDLPPVSVGDEWWFYYSGRTYRHGPYTGKDTGPSYGAVGLAKIKRGRLISLEASFDGGSILTKPLMFSGDNFFINANAKFGQVVVELLDENNKQLPGWKSVISAQDGVKIPVIFEGKSLVQLNKKPIIIKFTLSNAQLFGFQFLDNN